MAARTAKPVMKPSTDKCVYLTALDRRTRKAKCTTVYGLTPTQLLKLVEKAVTQRGASDKPDTTAAA